MFAAFGVAAPVGGESGTISSALNVWGGLVSAGNGGTNPDGPIKAFVNIIVFDKNYKLLDASWDGMSSSANQVGVTPVVAHDFMTREYIAKACLPKHLRRQEEGYVFMYVSNENPTLVDVYFDDVTMTYTPGNVIQYNACLPKLLRRQEYYPFGLQTSNSWTRTNTSNNYLYNEGTELNNTTGIYETLFRGYDAALGRFMQIDPLAVMDYSTSPFAYARNNPAVFNDPLGLLVDVTGYSDYQLRAMYRANRGNYGNFGDWAKDNLDFSGASSRIVDDGNGNFFGVNASGGFGRFVLANSYEVGYYTKVSTDGEKTWTNQRWTDVAGYDVYVWQAFEQQQTNGGNPFDYDLAGKVDVGASSILGSVTLGFEITSNQIKDSKYWLQTTKNTTTTVTKNLKFAGYVGILIGTGISFTEAVQDPSKHSSWARFGTGVVISATGFIPYVGLPIAIGLGSYEAAGGFDKFYQSFDNPVTRALYLQGMAFNNPFMFTGNTFK